MTKSLIELPTKEYADKLVLLFVLSVRDPQQFLVKCNEAAAEASGAAAKQSVHDMAFEETRRYRAKKTRNVVYVDCWGKKQMKSEKSLAGDFCTVRALPTRNTKKSSTPGQFYDSWSHLLTRIALVREAISKWPDQKQSILCDRYMMISRTARSICSDIGISETKMSRIVSEARFIAYDIMLNRHRNI